MHVNPRRAPPQRKLPSAVRRVHARHYRSLKSNRHRRLRAGCIELLRRIVQKARNNPFPTLLRSRLHRRAGEGCMPELSHQNQSRGSANLPSNHDAVHVGRHRIQRACKDERGHLCNPLDDAVTRYVGAPRKQTTIAIKDHVRWLRAMIVLRGGRVRFGARGHDAHSCWKRAYMDPPRCQREEIAARDPTADIYPACSSRLFAPGPDGISAR